MLVRSLSRSLIRPSINRSTNQSIARHFSSLTPASSRHDVKVSTNQSTRWCLVYGGGGALGQSIIQSFNQSKWKTISCDFNHNNEASENLSLDKSLSVKANFDSCVNQLKDLAAKHNQESIGLSCCVVSAGGWAGGSIDASNLFDTFESMMNANVLTSLAAAKLFNQFAVPNESFLLFTGALAATNRSGTPEMISYGISKASVHQLALSLASNDSSLTKKGATVACILPLTLDTPTNRMYMGGGDMSTWTPPEVIANQAVKWANQSIKRGGLDLSKHAAEARAKSIKHTSSTDEHHDPAHLVHGGFYSVLTVQGETVIREIEDPLALPGVVAQ